MCLVGMHAIVVCIVFIQFRANMYEDPVTGLLTHTMFMYVHIFNTRYVHVVPSYAGLKQLVVKSLAQGINMMAPGEVRTHNFAVTRPTRYIVPLSHHFPGQAHYHTSTATIYIEKNVSNMEMKNVIVYFQSESAHPVCSKTQTNV
jgi:hypothetical protein